jgi:hypothetical protein
MVYIVRTGQLSVPLSLTFHPEDMNGILKSLSTPPARIASLNGEVVTLQSRLGEAIASLTFE